MTTKRELDTALFVARGFDAETADFVSRAANEYEPLKQIIMDGIARENRLREQRDALKSACLNTYSHLANKAKSMRTPGDNERMEILKRAIARAESAS